MRKNNYYTYWATAFLGIVAIAFAPKYWIPLLTGNLALTATIHWHTFFATIWIIIYFFQTLLIRNRNIGLHQKLGYLSIVFALGVIISGFYVSLGLVEKALASNSAGAKPLLLVNLLDLLIFGLLYGLGIKNRRLGIVHKRFVTLAAIALLNAAHFRIGRFFIGPGFPAVLLAVVITSSVIILFVWSEKKHSQRDNKQLWRIALAIILVHIIRIPLAITAAWSNITDVILETF